MEDQRGGDLGKKGHKSKKTNQMVIEFWIQQVSANAPNYDSSCGDDGNLLTSIQTDLQQQGSGDGGDQVDGGVSPPPGAFLETDLTDETVPVRKDDDLELRLQHLLEQLGDESFFNFQESWEGAVQRNSEEWCSNMLEGMVESSGAVTMRACRAMRMVENQWNSIAIIERQ